MFNTKTQLSHLIFWCILGSAQYAISAETSPKAPQNELEETTEVLASDDSQTEEKGFRHSINFCPGGVALGIFVLNYEYLHRERHGLVVRFDYQTTMTSFDETALDFILNYRWHFSKGMNSFFAGVYLKNELYNSSPEFSYDISDTVLGLNAGKKWVWDKGFNIAVAFGYGISASLLKGDTDYFQPFYGEISIGYTF